MKKQKIILFISLFILLFLVYSFLINLNKPIKKIDIDMYNITNGSYAKGNPYSKTILIIFSDYECPFCKKAYLTEFNDNNSFLVFFKNMPLNFHKYSHIAAIETLCAGEQGKFWQAHDILFSSNFSSKKEISNLIYPLLSDKNSFDECVYLEKTNFIINKDLALAKKFEVHGTPTYILAMSLENEAQAAKIAKKFNSQMLISKDTVFVKLVGVISETGWDYINNVTRTNK